MDAVRRLTIALLLATVAALGASMDEPRFERTSDSVVPTRLADARSWRVSAPTVYDERRCTERRLVVEHAVGIAPTSAP